MIWLVNIAVNSLIQDPIQDSVLYAGTGEGFFNADAVRGQGIFRSSDYGDTWAHLESTDHPDFHYVQKLAATRHKRKQRIYAATRTGVPVYSLVAHPTQPDTLYIGTELGVFVTIDGGASWMRENTGFANVVTKHFEISNGRLFAFTHGRSAWSVSLAR